jgi:hypothetical protein
MVFTISPLVMPAKPASNQGKMAPALLASGLFALSAGKAADGTEAAT